MWVALLYWSITQVSLAVKSSLIHLTKWWRKPLESIPSLISGYVPVYSCILLFTYVYSCILLYTLVYLCILLCLQTIKAFVPDMISKNHGHVITIASAAGLFGTAGLMDYCASKFGAVGINESLMMELEAIGCTGVNTTVVCPYFIDTGMFDGVKSR